MDPPEPIPLRARGDVEPEIGVQREHFGDDPHLPVLEIRVKLRQAA